jgi:hypothetical protein
MKSLGAALLLAVALGGCGSSEPTSGPPAPRGGKPVRAAGGDYVYTVPRGFVQKPVRGKLAESPESHTTAVGIKGDDKSGVVVHEVPDPTSARNVDELAAFVAPRFRRVDGSVPKPEHRRMAGRPALRFTLKGRSVRAGSRLDGEAWFVLAPAGQLTVVSCQWPPARHDEVARGCASVVKSLRVSARRG